MKLYDIKDLEPFRLELPEPEVKRKPTPRVDIGDHTQEALKPHTVEQTYWNRITADE